MAEEMQGGEQSGEPSGGFIDAVPQEERGYVENKGWKGPGDVIKSYKNLEKLRGVPEDQLLRVPTDPDSQEQWEPIYSKLGRPKDASEYDFAVPEYADKSFVEQSKQWMHKAGLNKRQSKMMAEHYAAFDAQQRADYQAKVQSFQANAYEDLKKSWGHEYDSRVKLVDRTLEEFGVSDGLVTAARDAGFGAELLRVFEKVAMKSGEARYREGSNQPSFGMTPDAARQAVSDLNMDKDWVSAFLDKNNPGHKAAVEKKTKLMKIAYGS